jgi:hypothetical protein
MVSDNQIDVRPDCDLCVLTDGFRYDSLLEGKEEHERDQRRKSSM